MYTEYLSVAGNSKYKLDFCGFSTNFSRDSNDNGGIDHQNKNGGGIVYVNFSI